MNKCPHCGGGDSYSYKVYGLIEHRTGVFGNPEMDQGGDITESRPWPIWAKCDNCGKRIKLSDLE